MVTVYDIVEHHPWGDQTIATVWDELQAVFYCQRNPSCEVQPHEMAETLALELAE